MKHQRVQMSLRTSRVLAAIATAVVLVAGCSENDETVPEPGKSGRPPAPASTEQGDRPEQEDQLGTPDDPQPLQTSPCADHSELERRAKRIPDTPHATEKLKRPFLKFPTGVENATYIQQLPNEALSVLLKDFESGVTTHYYVDGDHYRLGKNNSPVLEIYSGAGSTHLVFNKVPGLVLKVRSGAASQLHIFGTGDVSVKAGASATVDFYGNFDSNVAYLGASACASHLKSTDYHYDFPAPPKIAALAPSRTATDPPTLRV